MARVYPSGALCGICLKGNCCPQIVDKGGIKWTNALLAYNAVVSTVVK